jgi:hypothetical protein
MKTSINVYDFREAFRRMERNNFSYDGLEVLFEYLEQLEEDCGQEMELDVVAICCHYAEEMPTTIAEHYSIDLEGLQNSEKLEDSEAIEDKVREYLNDEGVYVGTTDSGSIVYRQF